MKIGTAIPIMKDIYGCKITFSKGLGLCIENRPCKQEKIFICVFIQKLCKNSCVVYAANLEPNKLPEQEIDNYRVY